MFAVDLQYKNNNKMIVVKICIQFHQRYVANSLQIFVVSRHGNDNVPVLETTETVDIFEVIKGYGISNFQSASWSITQK